MGGASMRPALARWHARQSGTCPMHKARVRPFAHNERRARAVAAFYSRSPQPENEQLLPLRAPNNIRLYLEVSLARLTPLGVLVSLTVLLLARCFSHTPARTAVATSGAKAQE